MDSFVVRQTGQEDVAYTGMICEQIKISARERKTGIGNRNPEQIADKIAKGEAVIAVHKPTGKPAGFCYLAAWDQGTLVSHGALIIFPEFRQNGLGKKIKTFAVYLSRELFPGAAIFGLTSTLSVMKINSSLGYEPVTFKEISKDPAFWENCKGCVNYSTLESTGRSNCFCTSMLLKADKGINNVMEKKEKRA